MKWNKKMLTILTGNRAWSGRECCELLPILPFLGFSQLPCEHFAFIISFIFTKIEFTMYTLTFLFLIPHYFVFIPLFSSHTSLILRHRHNFFLSLSFCLLFFLLFMFYDIYLCCFHVCVSPSRAVKVYCASVFQNLWGGSSLELCLGEPALFSHKQIWFCLT